MTKQMEYIPDIYKQYYLNLTAAIYEEDCNSSRELEDEELEEQSTSSGKNKNAKKATRRKQVKSSVIRGSLVCPNNHVAQNMYNAQINKE
jgi:hypothetical protein